MTNTSYSLSLNLSDYRDTKLLDGFPVGPESINDGQIMVRIDKVALTSNSVSYVIGSQAGLMSWLDVFPRSRRAGPYPLLGFR